ncbi:sensor histidine kinase [Microbacterium xanthum]|uniref:sensor histidine kinase n=1 Tax=Microbacterium xanthum TaxID=3079794 RepID=UPI002AD39F8F|nr:MULTISPECIES: ATP-binding protein [unclassified Microbacterium]MDZ8171928.1 ATP-binding protein [Microbacterium sp. KSW-48]MDZ8199975.1 ATP-binding protein [Microbacterium sp. SSW1-59]
MTTTAAALLALSVGILIGAGIAVVIFLSFRARDRAQAQVSRRIPEGIREVLHGMEDPAAILDASSTVLASSAAAAPYGIVEGVALTDDDLRRVSRKARDADGVAAETFRLMRGAPPAEPRLVTVRATRVSARLTLIVLRDITERERVEQMRRDFVANTSHELKTPVGAVTLLAEAIESAADDPEQVRIFAARLTAEAQRLGSLTSRIMNLSRLQASDELTEMRDVAVDEVLTSAIEASMIQASASAVEIVRGGDRDLFVRGDAQVLSEALSNLITNAIAYSPAASKVGVGVKRVDDVVEIAVTDRGIGIPEADQQRIFERFYRTDQARSRRTGGTGLGLSIVKHAVQRHGGEVRLWSRPGRGSTFTIRLPLIEPPLEQSTGKRKKKKEKMKAQKNGDHR